MAYEQRSYSGDAADTTLASGISPTSLTFTVTAGTGSGYPSGSAGPFFVSLDWDTTTKAEKIKVTSRAGDVFTVATLADRGLDGTTAVTHDANATVRHCWTAIDAAEANKAVSETLGAVTTKGDLLAGTGLNTLARRGAGADNTILVADSTQPTGLSYKTLAALVGLITGANGTVLTADSGQPNGFAFEAAPTAAGNGIYGDGSDGTAHLDGTATVAWASKVGSVYTMTRSAYLTSLTIDGGVTLKPNGHVPFVNGTLTNNGTISADGGAAAGHTAGLGATVDATSQLGSLGAGAGAPGGTNLAGNGDGGPVGASTACLGGTGGAGGNGSTGIGGAAGTVTPPTTALRTVAFIFRLYDWQGNARVGWLGGQGGAAAGSDGTTSDAGSGGGGGGIVLLVAKTLVNTGTISAKGGTGGNAAGNAGGGGGGGGGALLAVYNSLTNSGSITVTGGAGGVKAGTGTNGSAGGTGTIVELSNA